MSDPTQKPSVDSSDGHALTRLGHRLVRLLDDRFVIPFTNIRFGFDSILGLFAPLFGDVTTGLGSIGLLTLALRRGVPRVVMGKMIINIVIDVVAGAIPLVGDIFDVAWRSNRRNLDLIEQYANPDATPSAADYAIVGVGIVLAVASVVLPIVVVGYLGLRFGPELWTKLFG